VRAASRRHLEARAGSCCPRCRRTTAAARGSAPWGRARCRQTLSRSCHRRTPRTRPWPPRTRLRAQVPSGAQEQPQQQL
jgi:hypothetical protein